MFDQEVTAPTVTPCQLGGKSAELGRKRSVDE